MSSLTVQDLLSPHITEMLRYFRAGHRVTVVVRDPDNKNGSVFIGNDDEDSVIEAINHLRSDPTTIQLPGASSHNNEPPIEWRPVEPYNDQDGGDCMMTIEEFVAAVAAGAFNDYDGFGECATATAVSNVRIYPSNLDRPSWTTHVCWYNK